MPLQVSNICPPSSRQGTSHSFCYLPGKLPTRAGTSGTRPENRQEHSCLHLSWGSSSQERRERLHPKQTPNLVHRADRPRRTWCLPHKPLRLQHLGSCVPFYKSLWFSLSTNHYVPQAGSQRKAFSSLGLASRKAWNLFRHVLVKCDASILLICMCYAQTISCSSKK